MPTIYIQLYQGGWWFATPIVTASVTGSSALIMSALYISYAIKVYKAFLGRSQVNKEE
jgi:hypothetical protein